MHSRSAGTVFVVSMAMAMVMMLSSVGVMANMNISFAHWCSTSGDCVFRAFGLIGGELVLMDSVRMGSFLFYLSS